MHALFDAILRRDIESIKSLLPQTDINVPDVTGLTPLMLAAKHDLPDVATLLLEAGADPLFLDKNDRTAAMHAVIWGSQQTLQAMLSFGAIRRVTELAVDDKLALRRRFSDLVEHSHRATPDDFKRLLDLGLDVNSDVYKGYDLMQEVETNLGVGNKAILLSVMRLLIESGYPPNAIRHESDYPLIFSSILYSDYDLFKTLVDHGASLDVERYADSIQNTHESLGIAEYAIHKCRNKNIMRHCLEHGRCNATPSDLVLLAIDARASEQALEALHERFDLAKLITAPVSQDAQKNPIAHVFDKIKESHAKHPLEMHEETFLTLLKHLPNEVFDVLPDNAASVLAAKACERSLELLLSRNIKNCRARTPQILASILDAAIKDSPPESCERMFKSVIHYGLDKKGSRKVGEKMSKVRAKNPLVAATFERLILGSSVKNAPDQSLGL